MVYSLSSGEFIIIGCEGFIGQHFCRALPDALAIKRSELELSKPRICFSTQGKRYALIAAGISNPIKCEREWEYSYQCNVTGTLELGKKLSERGITPIFLSTDYVFNDRLELTPLNAYGSQKATMEKQASLFDSLVLRLSKVYGVEKGDRTLFDEMATKFMKGEKVQAARDQIFSPIYIKDVILQTLFCLEQGVRGIVSLVGPSYASRLDMAKQLARRLKKETTLIEEIALDDLHDGIKRPKTLKLKSTFSGITWQEGVKRIVQAYG